MASFSRERRAAPKEPKREILAYQKLLVPLIDAIYLEGAKAANRRQDASSAILKKRIAEIQNKVSKKLQPIFYSVSEKNQVAWKRITGVSLLDTGIPDDLYSIWIKENTDLIKDLVPEMYKRAEATVKEATKKGLSQRDLTQRIREDLSVPKARANLIARDQILKANANLTAENHKYANIDKFRWITSSDERVREKHAELHGQIFSYDDLPEEGVPGTDFQCRCIAYPILGDS